MENYYNLTKNSRKFQTSVTERCTSPSKRSGMFRQNRLKVPVKKLNLYKNLYYTRSSSQVILRLRLNFFSPIYLSTYLQKTFIAHMFCICIHICKRYYFPLYYS